jgi:hypothetical protein
MRKNSVSIFVEHIHFHLTFIDEQFGCKRRILVFNGRKGSMRGYLGLGLLWWRRKLNGQ